MPAPTTVEQTRAPFPVRLLNKCGTALEKIGMESTAPSVAEVIDKGKRRCGLEDFGGDEFVEPLSRLLESWHRESRIHVIGKMALGSDVVRALARRLHVERDGRI